MIIYNYNPITKEYIGSKEARKSPLDGEWLIPRYATSIVPPKIQDGKVTIWNNNVWKIVDDNRGKTIYKKSDGKISILVDNFGSISTEYTLTNPPDNILFPVWDENVNNWIENDKLKKEYDDIQEKIRKNKKSYDDNVVLLSNIEKSINEATTVTKLKEIVIQLFNVVNNDIKNR